LRPGDAIIEPNLIVNGAKFQSAPGLEAGRCIDAIRQWDEVTHGFNPRPALRPGDAHDTRKDRNAYKVVSIRARP